MPLEIQPISNCRYIAKNIHNYLPNPLLMQLVDQLSFLSNDIPPTLLFQQDQDETDICTSSDEDPRLHVSVSERSGSPTSCGAVSDTEPETERNTVYISR